MIEKASICLERVKYLDPLQHVDSSCSIHFVEHISPMLKKKENLNLTRISPVMGGDQILWHFLNLEIRFFQMYVVRFSGFTVTPSMLRVSPSSLCCELKQAHLNSQLKKLQLNVQFLVKAVSTISYFNVYLDYEKSNS